MFSVLLFGCSVLGINKPTTLKIEGTAWRYSDAKKTYDVQFKANGRLVTSHPNDKTPNNDFWRQSGNTLYFSFNDGYAKYKGKFQNPKLITGKAKNKNKSWKWKLVRLL